MGLETHPNKHSVLYLAAKKAARKPYVYTRGKQSRTLIREMRQTKKFLLETLPVPSNDYPKELEGLWQGKSFQNPLYDNQDHESGNCSCKCTPTPKQNPTCPSDDKRRRKREDKNHLRGRPCAHILPEKEGY
jgi:hypothetical protein